MSYGGQIGELMGKIVELTGVAHAWKAKAEQQELEIEYLRKCLDRELASRSRTLATRRTAMGPKK